MGLIFGKNKVLDLVQGKVKEWTDEARKEQYRENDIRAMNLIVDGVKDNLFPYISTLNTSKKISTKVLEYPLQLKLEVGEIPPPLRRYALLVLKKKLVLPW